MNETLIGVFVGGLIASIAPITTLIIDHKRWKKETILEYLKSERNRLNENFEKTLEKLSKAMAENSYPSDMVSEIMIMMPENVSDKFIEFIEDKDKTENKMKNTYLDLAVEMKVSLKEIDDKIEKLIEI